MAKKSAEPTPSKPRTDSGGDQGAKSGRAIADAVQNGRIGWVRARANSRGHDLGTGQTGDTRQVEGDVAKSGPKQDPTPQDA